MVIKHGDFNWKYGDFIRVSWWFNGDLLVINEYLMGLYRDLMVIETGVHEISMGFFMGIHGDSTYHGEQILGVEAMTPQSVPWILPETEPNLCCDLTTTEPWNQVSELLQLQ